MNNRSTDGRPSLRRTLGVTAVVACIPVLLALAGCDQTTPPAPTTTTVTAPPQTTAGSGQRSDRPDGGGGVQPTRPTKPTPRPTSSEFNPSNCPTGLVC